jgi:hypothetical protein
MEAQELNVKGIGTINKSDWAVVLNMDDTVLIARMTDQTGPKLWLTIEEWEGRPTLEEAVEKMQPTVKFEKEPPVKFKTLEEAAEAFSKKKEEILAKKADEAPEKEEKQTEVTTVPREELDKLKTNELFALALFTRDEETVRKNLYCALGHCDCDAGEDDVNP